MSTQVIIGITGKMASGKGRVGEYLVNSYNVDTVKTSYFFREVLNLFDIPESRENLQKLSTFMRTTYGENILARALVKYAQKMEKPIIIVDGVRRYTDIENLKKLPNFFLVYVHTDQDIRYKRYTQRNENPGDGKMSFEIFLKEDSAEPEQQIESLREHADFVFNNNGTPEQLDAQIKETLKKVAPDITKKNT